MFVERALGTNDDTSLSFREHLVSMIRNHFRSESTCRELIIILGELGTDDKKSLSFRGLAEKTDSVKRHLVCGMHVRGPYLARDFFCMA